MRSARRLALVLLVAALPALLGAPAASSGAPDDPSFEGRWETTYGVMTLRQTADGKVTGTYEYAGRTSRIDGALAGRRLEFAYHESAAEGEGWFELAADGQAFSGKWRERGRVAWQPWTGRRLGEAPAPTFDGVWSTRFGRMRLVQTEQEVRGVYSGDGLSSIEGKVEGKRFTFEYKEPTAKGEGWFELVDGGAGLRGKWRPAGATAWADWDGKRLDPVPGRRWLVVIEARWESSLADREYSFGSMLKAFFARTPNVEVRHRFFAGKKSLTKWLAEVAFLAEPVVLVVATHGTPEGVTVDEETIGADSIVKNLELARGIDLLHFSSCLIMKDRISREILSDLGKKGHFAISGYTTSVDWAASAVIELMYLDMILSRDMEPRRAAKTLDKLMPFAGDEPVEGAPFDSAGFRFLAPGEVW